MAGSTSRTPPAPTASRYGAPRLPTNLIVDTSPDPRAGPAARHHRPTGPAPRSSTSGVDRDRPRSPSPLRRGARRDPDPDRRRPHRGARDPGRAPHRHRRAHDRSRSARAPRASARPRSAVDEHRRQRERDQRRRSSSTAAPGPAPHRPRPARHRRQRRHRRQHRPPTTGDQVTGLGHRRRRHLHRLRAASTVDLGSGGDTFTVDTTHAGTHGPPRTTPAPATTPSSSAPSRAHRASTLGLGDDTVRVSSTSTGNGGDPRRHPGYLLTRPAATGTDKAFVDDAGSLDRPDRSVTGSTIPGLGMTGAAPRRGRASAGRHRARTPSTAASRSPWPASAPPGTSPSTRPPRRCRPPSWRSSAPATSW